MTTQTASPETEVEPTVQVGDFFVSSWGYDQTNVDFYKVVGLTPSGKSVKVQQWTMSDTGQGGMHDSMVPSEEGGPVMRKVLKDGVTREAFFEMDYWDQQDAQVEVPVEPQTKRLQSYGSGAGKRFYFTVNSYSSASKWDGRPMYQTGYGLGH